MKLVLGTRNFVASIKQRSIPKPSEVQKKEKNVITMELLCELFKKKSCELVPDDLITENGTIKVSTRTGGTITSKTIISKLLAN